MKSTIFSLVFFTYIYNVSGQSFSTFENLTLQPNSFWNGADLTGNFQNGAGKFINHFTDWGGGFYSWDGFAYSNKKDMVTAGYSNQYSTYAGIGYNNSDNFALGYCYPTTKIRILNNDHPKTIKGFYVTNSTYTAISMRDGDAYSKKFGGTSGNDPDWFKLSVWGFNNGQKSDTVSFYLADYRFTNNNSDYIVKNWTWVDLSNIGDADSLEFALSSSDNGTYGMNTPAYFCLDNLTIDYLPENATTNNYQFLDQCYNYTFDLDTFFTDIDTPNSLLTYQIEYNSEPDIFLATITNNLLSVYVNCPVKNADFIYNDTLVIRAHSTYGYADLIYHFSSDIYGNIHIEDFNHVVIFPNPVSDFLNITTSVKTEISICDLSGRNVWSSTINKSEKINISSLEQGIYFISYQNQVCKFIKN